MLLPFVHLRTSFRTFNLLSTIIVWKITRDKMKIAIETAADPHTQIEIQNFARNHFMNLLSLALAKFKQLFSNKKVIIVLNFHI